MAVQQRGLHDGGNPTIDDRRRGRDGVDGHVAPGRDTRGWDDEPPPGESEHPPDDGGWDDQPRGAVWEPDRAPDDEAAWDQADVEPWTDDRAPLAMLTRQDVYSEAMRAGVAVGGNPWARLRLWLRHHLSSELQRREWAVDAKLLRVAPMSRPNTISVVSPKGGVGKTTVSFVLGNLFASQLHLRVVALDANPDFGTLSALAGDEFRSKRTLADLLADCERMESPAELHPYVSRLPTGLHLLGAPAHAEVMAQITPGLYARLLDFLERFYEVVILDLGTGITDPLAQFAVNRADQTVVITTPEWITAAGVLGALRYLQLDEGTLVLNQAPTANGGNRKVIEENFRRQAVRTRATIPYDQRLRTMLDTGTYDLPRLKLSSRVPVKELAVALADNFV